ncbi:hypothetical protein CsatB_005528 [Cannabis sativa]
MQFHTLLYLFCSKENMMISPKKLIMGRRLHKLVLEGHKRMSFNAGCCRTTFIADRGHFVIYSSDKRRFMLPLTYLRHEIFQELLKISEEEFGLPICGPIVLPCDSFSLNSIISLIRELENRKLCLNYWIN